MPKTLRILLAVLLLALPAAWWGLRTPPEEPSAPTTAQAPAAPAAPQPSADSKQEEPEHGAKPSNQEAAQEPSEEESEDADLEEELAGPGPCIELVVTAQGAPVPNAKVSAARNEGEDISTALGPLSVGSQGQRQAWCQPGEYRLAAIAPGFAASFVKVVSKPGGAAPVAHFELASGHTLSGRVLDKDSEQPLAGAELTAELQDDDFSTTLPAPSALSDARGEFRLGTLTPGTYDLSVKAPGHTLTVVTVEVPGRQSVSIELEGTSRIEGQVLDAAGTPVPGAKVWVGASGGIPEDAPNRTDAQGNFSLEVNGGTYLVGAMAGGQSGVLAGKVTVARGGLVDGLVIRMSPTGSLAGRVFLRTSQAPVPAVHVMLRHTDARWSYSAKTKEDGTFRAEGLLAGTYIVSIFNGGFSEDRKEDVRVQSGQETAVEFPLIREASLEGTVMDALGHPAEEATIVAVQLDAPQGQRRRLQRGPDETGHYVLSNLAPGRYRVEARLTGQGKPVTHELTLEEGEAAQADFFLEEALGTVQGTVRRASGGPPKHPVTIEAVSDEINDSTAEVDEKGHFTLKLRPGDYTFMASYEQSVEESPTQSVRVEAGRVAQVSLLVPDALAETSGVVLNARGEPVAEAGVSLTDGDELTSNAETDGLGRFTLRTALSTRGRTVFIEAENENGAEQGSLENVRVGSRGLVVRLLKASALRGRLVVTRGPPVQRFELQVFQIDKDGKAEKVGTRPFVGDTFEWVELPAKTLELRVLTADGRSSKVRTPLTPGNTATVEIPVGTLARVTGTLLPPSGRPVLPWVYADADTPAEQVAYPAYNGGHFEFLGLEPGKHSLKLGDTQILLVELSEGQTLDLGKIELVIPPKRH